MIVRSIFTQLDLLDLSLNKLTREISVQLVDNFVFLQSVGGKIVPIKQSAMFSKASYYGYKGSCGFPLKAQCADRKPVSSPPSYSDSKIVIDWNFPSAELGCVLVFGLSLGSYALEEVKVLVLQATG